MWMDVYRMCVGLQFSGQLGKFPEMAKEPLSAPTKEVEESDEEDVTRMQARLQALRSWNRLPSCKRVKIICSPKLHDTLIWGHIALLTILLCWCCWLCFCICYCKYFFKNLLKVFINLNKIDTEETIYCWKYIWSWVVLFVTIWM